MSVIVWDNVLETEDKPKMLEVYLEQTWQNSFCYALAVEEHEYARDKKLLLAIISGNDSSLQAIRAAVDLGSNGLSFGHGEKSLTEYEFNREFQLVAEKGKYEKFPITLNQNRKALAIVHDDLLGNGNYILTFEGDPAEDVRQVLGGGKFGLNILPEWKDIVFTELINKGYLEQIDFYFDEKLFVNGFSIHQLVIEEEEADQLISTLIKEGKLSFPKSGSGENLKEIEDLTGYMESFVNDMVSKLSEDVTPVHDPMVDKSFNYFDEYNRPLFPVQAHVATAIAKSLRTKKAMLLQGEMSTGKTTMLTALADAFYREKNQKGFFSCVMVPPNLTKKWPEEIKEVIPHAVVHVITRTEQLIRYHSEWIKAGRRKPIRPTFFVISFTTMRNDSAIVPAVEFVENNFQISTKDGIKPYRLGFYCPDCGNPHQVIDSSSTQLNEDGEEVVEVEKRVMEEAEFGKGRRLHNGNSPANAFCSECGSSLWTKTAPNRYSSFKEWAQHEKKLINAIYKGQKHVVKDLQENQPEIPRVTGQPRRTAAIEYIRRKMKRFFDISLVDEIHMLKSGMTAQGNSLGSLVAASKKVVGGTGTLFGGKAEDVYYLLWRLFPGIMVENGYEYSEVGKWNEEYGNIERTVTQFNSDSGEYTNKQSRGGVRRTEKVLPGISPFVFGKFLVQNAALVRLVDVWPDPVELVDVPTILVDMDEDLEKEYQSMISSIQSAIDTREDGHKLYLSLTQNGVAFPDNPFTYPAITFKNVDGDRDIIHRHNHLPIDRTLNKERKLQEIISGEIAEGRNSIVYVRDTGSTVRGRDVRPRLKKVLEDIGAKVAILDTTTTRTNARSEWLQRKTDEGYNVIIVSQELVKVGLDLISTPTLIFYQFSWSLFTINQAARRAWRIGQDEECRLYYIAYRNSYQEQMAQLIAQKNKAAAAINGDVSSDGLSAMLGDDGDLQSMLIESIKKGETLRGSTEEWVAQTSDRARQLLSGIGKQKKELSIKEQFTKWVEQQIKVLSTKNILLRKADTIAENIELGNTIGFTAINGVLRIDLIEAFGFNVVEDGVILQHLVSHERERKPASSYDVEIFELRDIKEKQTRRRVNTPSDGQLTFSLF